jgi:hypothetical protein
MEEFICLKTNNIKTDKDLELIETVMQFLEVD